MDPPRDQWIRIQFEELLDLCKIAWRPVLELLAREGGYSSIDFTKVEGHPWPLGQKETFPLNLKDLVSKKTPVRVRFLTVDEVLSIHYSMIREFGGTPGIRDRGTLESSLYRVQRQSVYGKQEFPTIIHQAAWLMHSIALYHPFLDGQKRTAVTSAFIFLGLNGFTFWSRDVADEIRMALRCAEGTIEVDAIAEWISDRVLPLGETLFIAPYALLLRRMSRQALCPHCDMKVQWKSLLNQCGSCGKTYQVRLRVFIVASGYAASEPLQVAASEAIAPVADGELKFLQTKQEEINVSNESAKKLLRSRGLDPSQFLPA